MIVCMTPTSLYSRDTHFTRFARHSSLHVTGHRNTFAGLVVFFADCFPVAGVSVFFYAELFFFAAAAISAALCFRSASVAFKRNALACAFLAAEEAFVACDTRVSDE